VERHSRWIAFVLLLLAIDSSAWGQKISDGGPLSAEQVIGFTQLKNPRGRRLISNDKIVEAIRNRGVTFTANSADFTKVQQAGLADEIIAAVREKAPVPQPIVKTSVPEPPRPETGEILVTCAPVECDVMVDNDKGVSTTAGRLRISKILGHHNVAIIKPGYLSEPQSVELTKSGARVSFSLRPDAGTKSRYGGILSKQMLDALGDDGIDVRGFGSLTVQKAGSEPVEYSFATRLGPTESIYAVQQPTGSYELYCRGGKCDSRKSKLLNGKELKIDQTTIADKDLRLFRRFYISTILALWRSSILSSALAAEADTDNAQADVYKFRLVGPDETYDVELDRSYRPIRVTLSPKLVSDSATVVTYSDYRKIGKLSYPKQISVKPPGDRAIKVSMDVLEPVKTP
jgi:hypothetical protein